MEFLVWVVDRGGAEPAGSVGTYYKGDVIVAKPDGWAWSAVERSEPRWRLVRVPVTQAQATQWSTFSAKNAAGHFWKRGVVMNWAALTPASLAAKFVFNGARVDEIIDLTQAQVQGIATTKANP